jgi:hypothetical protein
MNKTKPSLQAEVHALKNKIRILREGLWEIAEEYRGQPVSEWALRVLDYIGNEKDGST